MINSGFKHASTVYKFLFLINEFMQKIPLIIKKIIETNSLKHSFPINNYFLILGYKIIDA